MIFKVRVFFILFFLILFCGAIISKLFYIQIIKNKEYVEESNKQARQRIIISARRGEILDRKGRVLAMNTGNKVSLPTDAFQINEENIMTNNIKNKQKLANQITIKRIYPFGDIAAPLIGYIGKDGYGLGGVEYSFDKYLRGENGWAIVMRDGRNRKYQTIELPKKEPVPGNNIYLTIDIDIQKISENVIKQTVEQLKAKAGICIVMEPTTGKILAMVNYPSFNPNIYSAYSAEERNNRCIGYTFEPGSTFKAVTAACALQENIKKETDIINGNNGIFEIYGQKIRDIKKYGKITFAEAISYSSNVCFAQIANEIGNERLFKYTRDFGFGNITGIQLPGEEAGIVHPIEKWSGRTRVTMAIGQEISVTLIQMAMLFASIANKGVLLTPRIYEKICAADGTIIDSSTIKPIRRVISAEVAQRLTELLCNVVSNGTGIKAQIEGIRVAGKTGTAQKIDSETKAYSDVKCWSSFIGFAPAENPLILCAVMIDEPLNGETGGIAAAPAFKKIVSQIISHPQLEFAEKIFGNKSDNIKASTTDVTFVPDLKGINCQKAIEICKSENIPYKLIGDKQGEILYQEPDAGKCLSENSKLILYTLSNDSINKNVEVPNCVGRDLRDAINMLNLKEIIPYVKGAGIVKNQNPMAGCFIRKAEVCTLFCEFEKIM